MADVLRLSGAAREYLAEKFGGVFTELESSPSSAIVAASVVGNNPDRLGLLIENLGANTVFLSLAPNPSSTKGMALAPNGGSVSLTVDEDFTLVTRQFFAASPGGASQLYVSEMVRDITLQGTGGK